MEPYITLAEVGRHNLAHDAWVVVEGKVFEYVSGSGAWSAHIS